MQMGAVTVNTLVKTAMIIFYNDHETNGFMEGLICCITNIKQVIVKLNS